MVDPHRLRAFAYQLYHVLLQSYVACPDLSGQPRNIPQEVTSGGGHFRGSSDVIQEPKIGDRDVTSAPIGQIR